MNIFKSASLLLLSVLLFSNCVVRRPDHREGGRREEGGSYRYLGIPYGHLPPPGHCRIWYPGRPPGHQPPPVRCPIPFRQVPRGAWVVSWADESRGRLWVDEYDDRRDGIISRAREYFVDADDREDGRESQGNARWEGRGNDRVDRDGQGRDTEWKDRDDKEKSREHHDREHREKAYRSDDRDKKDKDKDKNKEKKKGRDDK